jgi:hypothetical protein
MASNSPLQQHLNMVPLRVAVTQLLFAPEVVMTLSQAYRQQHIDPVVFTTSLMQIEKN